MRLSSTLLALVSWLLCGPAAAQFATVINVPPEEAPALIGSNTQLNVGPGGIVYTGVSAGQANVAGTNIEVNVAGGVIQGGLQGYHGSTSNVSGGEIRNWTEVFNGATLNVSGGTLSLIHARAGSTFNFSGGQVSGGFSAYSGSTVNIAGGFISGGSDAQSGSTVNVVGGRVRMLAKNGSTVNVSSGTLEGEWLGTSAQGATITMTGGEIGDYYRATANSKVNVTGGAVGYDFRVDTGSTLTMSGGTVDESMNANTATINLSGGKIGGDFLGNTVTINLSGSGELGSGQINTNSKLNMTGGVLTGGFDLFETTASISGGVFGDGLRVHKWQNDPTAVRLFGRDFRLDGVPITVPAATYTVTGVLSGVLADGTPFAFSSHDSDQFDVGTLTLVTSGAPAAPPGTIRASTDAIPRGVRQGQTLLVDAGGVIGDNFNAGHGSVVNVELGGQVGKNFEAAGATVTMSGGTIGDRADLFSGAVMTMSGGHIGASLAITKNSTLNMTGGAAGDGLAVLNGGALNLSGGVIGNNVAISGGVANISGGEVGRDLNSTGTTNITGGRIGDSWYAAGDVLIAGGAIGDELETRYNANVTVEGTDFRINGVPVAGLNEIGDTVNTSSYFGQLSCILADGTPLVLDIGDRDNLQARFDLKLAAPAAAGAPMIVASTDVIPFGLRQGQLLVVDAGGSVRESFTAVGGVVVIQPGGAVGDNLELLNATALMAGGTLGDHADVFRGATLTISGGEAGDWLQVHDEGTLNVSGGSVGSFLEAKGGGTINVSGGSTALTYIRSGAVLNVSGGLVGGITSTGTVHLSGGSIGGARIEAGRLDMSGGDLGNLSEAWAGSVVSISGGRVGHQFTFGGAALDVRGGAIGDAFKAFTPVTLHGGEFRLNGELIAGLSTPGQRVALDLATDALLTGVLADGTPFAFSGRDIVQAFDPADSFAAGTLVLQSAPLPAIDAGDIRASRGGDPLGVRAGQRLIADAAVGNHFNAGAGSEVLVEQGGSIGENFEALGAQVTLTGGSIGNGLDALPGTTVVNAGGSIGDYVQIFDGAAVEQTAGSMGFAYAHAGSMLRVAGGRVEGVEADTGATIELSGGELGSVTAEGAASITMTGGSLNGYYADGGVLTVSGGALRDTYRARTGSLMIFGGGDFRLDGVPIAGLEELGAEAAFSIHEGKMLTGVLKDGTPFAMAKYDGFVDVANDFVRVRKAGEVPPIGPALITASSGSAPLGIRQGQTLIVDAGASLASNFNASWGSSVIVEAGAQAGDNLEGVGAAMELRGIVGDSLGAYNGTTVLAVGATIGEAAAVKRGSSLRLEGGSIGEDVQIADNSFVEVIGGAIGRDMQMHNSRLTMTSGSVGNDAFIYASRLDVQGGAVHGDLWVDGNSTINHSGGTLGFGNAIHGGSTLNILGSGFLLNGAPLSLTPGLTQTISQRNVTLSGVLADGTSFSTFLSTSLNSSSYYASQARITVTVAAAAGDFDGNGVVDGNDLVKWQLEIGQNVAPGARSDGNRDGVVGGLDLPVWRAAMAASSTGSAAGLSAQVPESASITITAMAGLLVALGCRPERPKSSVLYARRPGRPLMRKCRG